MNINEENEQMHQMATQEDEEGISVPNWLIDVLKWITRIEMANSSLSHSCRMFKLLCWPKLHEDVEPHIVPYLNFCYEPDKLGNIRGILQYEKRNEFPIQIPIAASPPPDYILGFGHIEFNFLDNRVIEFARNISHIKNTLSIQIFIQTIQTQWNANDDHVKLLRTFFAILANYHLCFSAGGDTLQQFYRLFPAILNQLTFLDVCGQSYLNFDILFDWLMMKPKNADRKQKLLNYVFSQINNGREQEFEFINRIKEEFSSSTEKRIFLIKLVNEFDQFIVENQQTGEMLNLYQKRDRWGRIFNFLARYPKGEELNWIEGSVDKFYPRSAHPAFFSVKIAELKEMKENKANILDCSSELTFADEAYTVTHLGSTQSYNSVRAVLPVHFFNQSMLQKYIACYFEVKILNHCDVGIGFGVQNFPLKDDFGQQNNFIGGRNNSIGFWQKEGAFVDGLLHPFGEMASNDEFNQPQKGDVIGCGLLHYLTKNLLTFFVAFNGELLGMVDLPPKFIRLQLFPTICLGTPTVSVHANFGKEAFCFDRSKLFTKEK